jgi:uncharacterized OB-fold protein
MAMKRNKKAKKARAGKPARKTAKKTKRAKMGKPARRTARTAKSVNRGRQAQKTVKKAKRAKKGRQAAKAVASRISSVKKPARAARASKPKADTKDCFIVKGKLALPYTYFAGRTGSKFITTVRDQQKIMGVKCNKCNKVFMPPKQTCEICMEDLRNNWVELANTGVVTNYTVVRYDAKHLPRKAPLVLAMIKLNGADTPFVHILEEVSPAEVKVGMKVDAVFAKASTNTILDIDHFKPVV